MRFSSPPGRVCLLLCLLAASACRRQAPLPELPTLSMDGFVPAVRSEVQKALNSARETPQDPNANGRLGMVLHAHQQHGAAEICYRRAHMLDPKYFDWTYYLALVQEAQGKNAEAIENLTRATRMRPDYAPARLRLGDSLFAAGDLDRSERMYASLAKEDPELAAAHYGLGRVMSARSDAAGAITAFKKAVQLFPGYGSAHFALAAAYRKTGDKTSAEYHTAAHARAKSAAPPREDVLESKVMALNAGASDQMNRGLQLEAAGRVQEAAEAHERALEIDPTLVQAHINLVSLYGRMGKPELAQKHYHEALALHPGLADAHYNYGVLLFGTGRVSEAKQAFQKAIAANPRHAEAQNNLGYVLMQEGKLKEAERHFGLAIDSQPDHRLAHFHLGRLLANRKDYNGAIEHFSQILEPEDEQTPGFTYALAAAYARAGDRYKALDYARLAQKKAAALGQTELLASIQRDIRALEQP